jgi:hypothetical protein
MSDMAVETQRERLTPGGRRLARAAGLFYLVTFVAGTIALITRGPVGMVAGAIAAAAYVAVTVLFYFLFKPVDRWLSLIAAIVSLGGIAVSAVRLLPVNPLVFFGVYCTLLALLIARSSFVPKVLGGLLAFAALGWFTFADPALARSLYPYNFAPGMIGEGALTVWLLALGGRRADAPAHA